MDWAGSRSASYPRTCASSPNFSHGTPKCSAKNSKTAVMERNHVDSWCGPNFPRSPWASQCFPCRCAWLLAADWQCQQAFTGTQNHGKWMACMCLLQAPPWFPTHCTLCQLSVLTCWFFYRLYCPRLLWHPRWSLLWHCHYDGPHFHGELQCFILLPLQTHCPRLLHTATLSCSSSWTARSHLRLCDSPVRWPSPICHSPQLRWPPPYST